MAISCKPAGPATSGFGGAQHREVDIGVGDHVDEGPGK
jgi:hypothetical protein